MKKAISFLLVLCLSGACEAAATLAQTHTCDSSSASCSITMTATASGSIIIVSLSVITSSGQTWTVTDNQLNSYTCAIQKAEGNDFRQTQICYASNTTAGVTSISVTSSGGAFSAIGQELTGMLTSSVVDSSATVAQGSAVTNISGPALATTNPDTLIVAVLSSAQQVTGVNSPWLFDASEGGTGQFTFGYGVAHIINTSAGTYTPTFTRGSSGFGTISSVAFKGVSTQGGGGAATVCPSMGLLGVGCQN